MVATVIGLRAGQDCLLALLAVDGSRAPLLYIHHRRAAMVHADRGGARTRWINLPLKQITARPNLRLARQDATAISRSRLHR
jgi:hypothetical protein